MSTNTFVELDIPEAKWLADLNGICWDFKTAIRFAEQLDEMFTKDPPDHSLVDPMSTAILVRYSRPFAKGIRTRLGEDALSGLSKRQREEHDRLRNWRDKHIAHSVNVFEDNQPVARYWVERFEEEGFSSVECNAHLLVGLSSHDIRWIVELSQHFLAELEPQLKAEKERVLGVVRSLPREKVLAMKKPVSVPDPKNAAKDRKQ